MKVIPERRGERDGRRGGDLGLERELCDETIRDKARMRGGERISSPPPKLAAKMSMYLCDLLVDLSSVLELVIGIVTSDHLQKTHTEGVNVDLFTVSHFLVHFWCHELRGA